jgi:hypothetical protein
MTQQSHKLFRSAIQEVWEYCQSEIDSSALSARRRTTLGEAALVIEEVLRSVSLSSVDRVLLEKVFYKISHIIYDEESLFYYSSFYYSYQEVKKGLKEAQNHFVKANLDILAMRLKVRLIRMGVAKFGGNSTDQYFLSRLEQLTWGIKYVFNKSCVELYIPALYALANLHQTLIELLDGAIAEKNRVQNKLRLVNSLLVTITGRPEIKKTLAESMQLSFFVTDQFRRFQLIEGNQPSYEFSEIAFDSLDWTPQTRSLTSLSFHTPDKFREICSHSVDNWLQNLESMQPIAKIWLTFIMTRYIKLTEFSEVFTLDLNYSASNSLDIDEVMTTYFSAYRAISSCSVSQADLDTLFALDDNELRIRLGKSLINLDRVVIEREARKPHGVSEIADMEIPLSLKSGKTHYLCMPFKSALEVRKEAVSVDYSYQIIRPFTFFDNCVVVFVTAKKCSQPLMNSIKQMREKFNWQIGVLQHSELAALLKLNGNL